MTREVDETQDWDGHRRSQLRRLARLSLIEKILWLDDAHELVRHVRDTRAARVESRATVATPLAPPDGDRGTMA